MSRCATDAQHTHTHTHRERERERDTGREMREMERPLLRLGVKSSGRDGPRSWLPLGTSAWLCGKDRRGAGGVESISEGVGLTPWCREREPKTGNKSQGLA